MAGGATPRLLAVPHFLLVHVPHFFEFSLRVLPVHNPQIMICSFPPNLLIPRYSFAERCVLVYLPPCDADELLQWAAKGPGRNSGNAGALPDGGGIVEVGPSLFAAFEMVYPSDAFGEMMVR